VEGYKAVPAAREADSLQLNPIGENRYFSGDG